MKDFMSNQQNEIRDQTLKSEALLKTNATHPNQAFNEFDAQMEEMHYFHTINDLVELIVLYGQDKVMHDLKLAIGWKKT